MEGQNKNRLFAFISPKLSNLYSAYFLLNFIYYIATAFLFQANFTYKEDFMHKTYKVGIIGATGMVGQRLVTLLDNHPWFEVIALAASERSAGNTYEKAVFGRWAMHVPIPDNIKDIVVLDADKDAEKVADMVDFVFCSINLNKETTKTLEEKYAMFECPVMSNNSANRGTPDVPMIIPELNPEHAEVIKYQRERLGTKRGFIAVKSNCSIQSYVPALHPIREFGIEKVLVCTYQAISGAGKNFTRWPEMVDNVIPYISGEETKSELEPLKIWGSIYGGKIINADSPSITSQCLRVPVSDGHTAAVFVSFRQKPNIDEIKRRWAEFRGEPQLLGLPTAPSQFLKYFEEPDRPQTKLDRDFENGMGITIGRLREDSQYDYKFICLSHNTIRGAAGGNILMAELLAANGYFN